MQPGSGKAISLFDADPELVRYVDAVHVEAAWSRAVAAVAILRPGDVSPRDWVEVSDGHLGLLVLDGLLTRNVTLLGRTALDLVGSEDLIRPWEDATEHSSVPRSVTWTVHRRTSVAVLDQGFVERVAPWPGIVAALLSRSLTRARWLGFHLAILENPRVDVRLMLLFWELADRWGRIGPEGVTVPLKLTHKLLGRLVRAQRPSVTASVRDLDRRGMLSRRDDGTWLLHGQASRQLGMLTAD